MRFCDGRAVPAAEVLGVHGAAGRSTWRQLAPGHAITGPWEAVELASVPPGGVSGVHRHTRTAELYFVVAGAGTLSLNGTTTPVRPGWVAFVGPGDSHGLAGTGSSGVDWLVLEAPVRRTTRDIVEEGPGMSAPEDPARRVGPVDLVAAGSLDLSGSGLDPLEQVGITDLGPGESAELSCPDVETFVYLLHGTLRVDVEGDRSSPPELVTGDGLTLTLGERVTVRATTASRYFVARVAVQRP